jgi:uncharacterized Zn-finger protein
MTYYRNLPRHLTAAQEHHLDAIVQKATSCPQAGIGYPPRHEHPRIWLEDCDQDTARLLDRAIANMGLLPEESS